MAMGAFYWRSAAVSNTPLIVAVRSPSLCFSSQRFALTAGKPGRNARPPILCARAAGGVGTEFEQRRLSPARRAKP
jgi:hypothetical protein